MRRCWAQRCVAHASRYASRIHEPMSQEAVPRGNTLLSVGALFAFSLLLLATRSVPTWSQYHQDQTLLAVLASSTRKFLGDDQRPYTDPLSWGLVAFGLLLLATPGVPTWSEHHQCQALLAGH